MGQSHSDFESPTVKFLLAPSVHLLHDYATEVLIAMHCNHLFLGIMQADFKMCRS